MLSPPRRGVSAHSEAVWRFARQRERKSLNFYFKGDGQPKYTYGTFVPIVKILLLQILK
jgi:hypothetical protein